MLTELLSFTVLVALASATLLICFEKWGWLRAWEVYGPRWFPRCDFCGGFWLAVILSVAAVALLRLPGAPLVLPWWYVGGAFPAAALCRFTLGFSKE